MADPRPTCPIPAHYRFTWPGREERVVCAIHGHQIQTLAAHMGLPLQFVPVEFEPDVLCTQPLTPDEQTRLKEADHA